MASSRVLFISDLHYDARTAGVPRFDDVCAFIDQVAVQASQLRVDHVVACGDYYDPGSDEAEKYAAALASHVVRLADVVPGSVVLVAGNHDVCDYDRPVTTLSALARIAKWQGDGKLVVCELPQVVKLVSSDRREVALFALPYVARSCAQLFDTALELAKATATAGRIDEPGVPLVVASHLMLPGMHPGSEDEMVRGRDIPFPVGLVAALKPDVIVQGHYHKPQQVALPVPDVVGQFIEVHVIGSPCRVTFGEVGGPSRGFLVADVGSES